MKRTMLVIALTLALAGQVSARVETLHLSTAGKWAQTLNPALVAVSERQADAAALCEAGAVTVATAAAARLAEGRPWDREDHEALVGLMVGAAVARVRAGATLKEAAVATVAAMRAGGVKRVDILRAPAAVGRQNEQSTWRFAAAFPDAFQDRAAMNEWRDQLYMAASPAKGAKAKSQKPGRLQQAVTEGTSDTASVRKAADVTLMQLAQRGAPEGGLIIPLAAMTANEMRDGLTMKQGLAQSLATVATYMDSAGSTATAKAWRTDFARALLVRGVIGRWDKTERLKALIPEAKRDDWTRLTLAGLDPALGRAAVAYAAKDSAAVGVELAKCDRRNLPLVAGLWLRMALEASGWDVGAALEAASQAAAPRAALKVLRKADPDLLLVATMGAPQQKAASAALAAGLVRLGAE